MVAIQMRGGPEWAAVQRVLLKADARAVHAHIELDRAYRSALVGLERRHREAKKRLSKHQERTR